MSFGYTIVWLLLVIVIGPLLGRRQQRRTAASFRDLAAALGFDMLEGMDAIRRMTPEVQQEAAAEALARVPKRPRHLLAAGPRYVMYRERAGREGTGADPEDEADQGIPGYGTERASGRDESVLHGGNLRAGRHHRWCAPAYVASHDPEFIARRSKMREGDRRQRRIVQVALSLMLLIGSGLLVKSFLKIQGADVGFASANLLLADVRPPAAMLEDGERLAQFYRDLGDRVAGAPGVRDVALAEQLPFLPGGLWNYVYAGDRPVPSPEQRTGAQRRRVGAGHFRALGITVLQGREIASSDMPGRPPVVVINQALADELWPGERAVGKTLVLPWDPEIRMEVVGVVANIREFGPASDPRPTFYPPLGQMPARAVQIGVRTTGDPLAVVSLVKQAAASVDPSVAISAFETMESRFMSRTAAPRFRTVLLTVFGVLALVVAATGLYGLLAYLVAQRAHEIGVRLALGACPREILWLVVRRGAWLAALGITCGIGGALALSGVMRGLLHQVSPTDPATLLAVSAGLGLVALAACLVPGWRAASIDPAGVLRQE